MQRMLGHASAPKWQHAPMLAIIVTQVLTLICGLALAYVTGAWRRYGHRMERLYDLAIKMPVGSPTRKRFEDAADAEAVKMANRSLHAPPASVMMAFRFIGYTLLIYWALFLVNRQAESIGRNLGMFYADAGITSEQVGIPLWLS